MNDFNLDELRRINSALINYYNSSSNYLPKKDLEEINKLQHKVKYYINLVKRERAYNE